MRRLALTLALCAATAATADTLGDLRAWLAKPVAERPALAGQPFAAAPLSRADAAAAQDLLWADHVASFKAERAAEVKARELREGELVMPFWYTTYGDKPADGRSLYISMHGGGSAPRPSTTSSMRTRSASIARPKASIWRRARRPTPGTCGTSRTSTACSTGSSKT